jgi:hypothetical protein
MGEKIISEFIIEIGGKPIENVEKALKSVEDRLKAEKKFKVIESEISEPEIEEKSKLYLGFIDIKIQFKEIKDILDFVYDYTPSSIEIQEPENLKVNSLELTGILNDMSNKFLKNNAELRQMRAYIHMLKKEKK